MLERVDRQVCRASGTGTGITQRCIIYTITSNDSSIQGVIKEIGDGGMVIEKSAGEREIINLDYVTRIREYPTTKRGRKKGVVLD